MSGNSNEEDEGYDDAHLNGDEGVIEERACLVKHYALIKEEMLRTTAISICNHLYQGGFLTEDKYHCISNECGRRREAVEELLKKVLMGPHNIHGAFTGALILEKEHHIAEKLKTERATKDEILKYRSLRKYSLRQGPRPDGDGPRLNLTKDQREFLLFQLIDVSEVDSINDYLLSQFYICIREHNSVARCRDSQETRVQKLLDILGLCPAKIYTPFCEILRKLNSQHVIDELERLKNPRKRKWKTLNSNNDQLPSTSTIRNQMSDDEEEQVVQSIKKSPENLQKYTKGQIGFEFDTVSKDSSISIYLRPKDLNSWRKLEEKCRNGKIKGFLQVIFRDHVDKESLREGVYRLKFTIYRLAGSDSPDDKTCMFHLEADKQNIKGTKKKERYDNKIEDQMDLLGEEIEITHELLSRLKEEKLVSRDIKDKIDKQATRAMKNRYLLTKLALKGTHSYKVLKDFVSRTNQTLYRDMIAREGEKEKECNLEERKLKKRQTRADDKELFYSGIALVHVNKTIRRERRGQQTCSIEIKCPEIINPVLYVSAGRQLKTDRKYAADYDDTEVDEK